MKKKYTGKFKNWQKIKEDTIKKYNYQCAICRTKKGLVVHHIDGEKTSPNYKSYWERNNKPENLLLLCRKCHSALHRLARENLKLGKRLTILRNETINELWEKHSEELERNDIGKIFGLSAVQIYRILTERKKY